MPTMFDRYSEQARRTIYYARYEAIAAHELFIDSHHLLIALLFQQPEMLCLTLGSIDNVCAIRRELVSSFPTAPQNYSTIEIPLGDQAKQILLSANEEARLAWKHDRGLKERIRSLATFETWPIRTQHLLLGIAGEARTAASQLLQDHGLSWVNLRERRRELNETDFSSRALLSAETAGVRRWTPRMRAAAAYAEFEAARLCLSAVRPEHFLLALCASMPTEMERLLGCTHDLRGLVRQKCAIEPDDQPAQECPPSMRFDIDCLAIFSCANDDSEALRHAAVDCPHLLIGILRAHQSFASQLLRDRGFGIDEALAFASEPPS